MAITSELIGSLNTPGYGFLNKSPRTYILPKFFNGASIIVVRWGGSNELSYDVLDRETGKVLDGVRKDTYATTKDFISEQSVEVFAKGALFRCNNSTPMQVYIIPNPRQTPPVWNGK